MKMAQWSLTKHWSYIGLGNGVGTARMEKLASFATSPALVNEGIVALIVKLFYQEHGNVSRQTLSYIQRESQITHEE